jgi:hypothetical protein
LNPAIVLDDQLAAALRYQFLQPINCLNRRQRISECVCVFHLRQVHGFFSSALGFPDSFQPRRFAMRAANASAASVLGAFIGNSFGSRPLRGIVTS